MMTTTTKMTKMTTMTKKTASHSTQRESCTLQTSAREKTDGKNEKKSTLKGFFKVTITLLVFVVCVAFVR